MSTKLLPDITQILMGQRISILCSAFHNDNLDPIQKAQINEDLFNWLNNLPMICLGRHDPNYIPFKSIQNCVYELQIKSTKTKIKSSNKRICTDPQVIKLNIEELPLPTTPFKIKPSSSLEVDPPKIVRCACDLAIEMIKLHGERPSQPNQQNSPFIQWMLPHKEFHGLWETLYFEEDLKQTLLETASTSLYFTKRNINNKLINCNRMLFLYGPPGTGKTSVCKAITHQLSIRMKEDYENFYLLEINAHSLFSKWFSESGKLTLQLFTQIKEMCDQKESFIFILIDEVESLASARTSAVSNNEPSDSLRVVNTLLTQLDSLKQYTNCLLLTTSNITKAVDDAFLDRADIRQFIPHPTLKGRYIILKDCVHELMNKGVISAYHKPLLDYEKLNIKQQINESNIKIDLSSIDETELINPSQKLLELSKMCNQFSGRTLRKLPFQAFTLICSNPEFDEMLRDQESIGLNIFYHYFSIIVKNELESKARLNKEEN